MRNYRAPASNENPVDTRAMFGCPWRNRSYHIKLFVSLVIILLQSEETFIVKC